MAFMNGPDCGPVNPLQSLLKSQEQDGSIQRDRFQQVPVAGTSGTSSMRTHPGGAAALGGMTQADLDREMQQFSFGMPGQVHAGHRPTGSDAFAMDAMQRELAQFRQANGSGSPQMGSPGPSAWAKEFGPSAGHMPQGAQQAHAWRQTFLAGSPQQQQEQQRQQQQQAGPSQQQPAMMSSIPGMAYQHSMSMYSNPMYMQQPMFNQQQQYRPADIATASAKGKSRFVELDNNEWEAQFAKLEQSKTDDARAQQVPESFIDGETVEPAEVPDESDAQFLANLEHTWKNLKDTLDTSNLNDNELAAWEAQYGTSMADLHGGDFDYDSGGINPFDPAEFDDWLKSATSKPYPFVEESENPYIEAFDPFSEGQRLLREGHPLAEAALAFEAACRQNEHRGEAWKALGETLAADEKELKAIKALERAVACPDNGGEGAWMSLAISYVNEGQDMRAFATLEKWITQAYPDASTFGTEVKDQSNPWSTQSKIVDQFLNAARAGPSARSGGPREANSVVDADVQSGLGVLYYTASDYIRARDCFEAALSARPDDFLLWNRLGATLANGGQPEEAIEAYRKALELRPTFTRAIYNLGVSCLNINCFQEAAEHLLAALELHRKDQLVGKGKGPERSQALEMDDGSENLWSTLRRAFMCMDRQDLAERAHPGGDVDSFRKEGFEF